ncbi:unnamed protein product [Paramecium primaurelia]|uniref:Uncharacterized protein n=1 Tax=Paramecium primaurelia TaxID=5886 RepID=A0A8S1NIF5_PARPR|nr:unnamed protein product [Paramecium primaurelia]
MILGKSSYLMIEELLDGIEGRNYRKKEYLRSKMKELELYINMENRWMKQQLMKAYQRINPKIFITGGIKEQKIFYQNSNKKILNMQQVFNSMGFCKIIESLEDIKFIIRGWDQFPVRIQVVIHKDQKRRCFTFYQPTMKLFNQ